MRKQPIRQNMFTVLLIFTLLPVMLCASTVYAANADSKTVAGLGVSAISNPTGIAEWSYVYYGKYNGIPVKYRVLDKAATEFGDNTMLLDCNDVLFLAAYSTDAGSVWENSSLREGLNGNLFLNKPGVFTAAE